VTARRPKDLVFTLFGEYLLDRGASVWVGSLIALLLPFELTEGAVRTALSRMVAKGWLSVRREGRRAYYGLTPRGRRLLEEGQARIYNPTWDVEWNGRWVVLAYSIPEESRSLRDRLRDRLGWLGFGSLGNGLWISPHRVAGPVREVADQLGISRHVECFDAERVSDGPVEALVEKCWDLAGLDARYRGFVRAWEPTLRRCASENPAEAPDPAECFALRFRLIHEFRGFPLEDPYLPRRLLPDGWHGDEANRLFHELHDLLAGPADQHVDGVLAAADAGSPSPTAA